tara:strand:+ start:996 stop:5201 length:4206 start_codon:yes stop_codon:yes gene_type:complete
MADILPLDEPTETPPTVEVKTPVPRFNFNVRQDGTIEPPPISDAPISDAPISDAPISDAPILEEFTFNIPRETIAYEDVLTHVDNKGAPAYAKTVIERYNERFGTNLDYEELLKESGGAEQALIDRFVVPYPQKIDISIKALQDVSPDGIAEQVFSALPNRLPGITYRSMLETNYELYQESPNELLRGLNPEEAFIHRYVNGIKDLKSAPKQLLQDVSLRLAEIGPSFAAASGLGYLGAAVAGTVGLPVTTTVVGLGALGYGLAELSGAGDYFKGVVQDKFYGDEKDGQKLPSDVAIQKGADAIAEGAAVILTLGPALGIKALRKANMTAAQINAAVQAAAAQTAARNASSLSKIPYVGTGAAKLRQADNAVANYFSGVGETAIRNPITMAAFEGSGIVAAGGGATIAENIDPGDVGTSIGAQMIAPVLIPGRVLLNVGAGLVQKVKSTVTGDAAERAAAKDMLEFIRGWATEQTVKGSPEEIQALTEETIRGLIAKYASPGETLADLVPGVQQTAAEVAAGAPGADIITALTREFVKRDGGEALRGGLETNMRLISELADTLFKTGDPALLGIASSLRRETFSALVQRQIDDRARSVTEAAEGVIKRGDGGSLDVVEESVKMQKGLEASLDFSRAQEKKLYEALDGTQEFNVTETVKVLDEIIDTANETVQPPLDILNWAWNSFSKRPVPKELLDVFAPYNTAKSAVESARKTLRNAVDSTPELTGRFDVLGDTFDDLDTLKAYSDDLLKPAKEREIFTKDFMEDIGLNRSMTAKEESALSVALKAKQRLINAQKVLGSAEATLDAGVDVAGLLKTYIPTGVAREEVALTLKQLTAQRSVFLAKGKELAKAGDNDARYYFQVAEGIAEDIGKRAESIAARGATGVPLTEAEKGIILANDFSYALNETFTRSYVDTATGRLAPEEVIDSVFKGVNTDVVSKRIQEVIDASKFIVDGQFSRGGNLIDIPENVLLEGYPPARTISDSLNNILRASIDPTNKQTNILDAVIDKNGVATYTINTQKLAQFRKSYEGVLKDYFPDLYEDLASAETASRFFDLSKGVVDPNIVKTLTRGNKFFDFIGVDKPSVVMGKIFAPGNTSPAKDLNEIIDGIRKPKSLPRDVTVEQLESGVVEALVQRAWVEASSGATFSFKKFKDVLQKPLASGSKGGNSSALNILRQRDVLSDTQWAQLNILLKQGEAIEQALKSGVDSLSANQVAQLKKSGNFITRFFTKMGGIKLGTGTGQLLGGSGSLQQATAGVDVVESVLDKIPRAMLKNVLFDAIKEPELMQALLKKTLTASEGIKFSKFLRSYYASSLLGPDGEEDPSIGKDVNRQILNATFSQMNPAVIRGDIRRQTTIPPVVVPPPPPITPLPSNQGAAVDLSGPFNPETFKQLFPNDGRA